MKLPLLFFLELFIFDIAWFLLVVMKNEWAISIALILLGIQFYIIHSKHKDLLSRIPSILAITSLGFCIDSLLVYWGVFDFGYGASTAPLWLLALWLHFSTTAVSCLQIFKNIGLTAVAGAFFGPLSYYAGYKLGAVALPLGTSPSIIILALIWFFLFPLSLYIGKKRSVFFSSIANPLTFFKS
ncbi:MAG: DUF2878 domain-containing protein [Pseudomonadota bacterium]